MTPIVVCYASHHRNPGLDALRDSCIRRGWAFEALGGSDIWAGFGAKVRSVAEGLPRWRAAGYTHAIHVDAYDVLALGTPDELPALMASYGDPPFLLATEVGCWPDASKAERHPPCAYPWRYAHSLYVWDVRRPDILDAEGLPDHIDDQNFLMEKYLDGGQITLDYECRVFQALAHLHPWDKWFAVEEGRVVNKATTTKPLFVHGNGRTAMEWVPQ